MIRYWSAATALRLFSLNATTRRGYRWLGNRVGGSTRAKRLPAHYIRRADQNLRAIEALGAVGDGARIMELGTGWAHWEALFTRLFHDVDAVLFDVWDNRQFAGFMTYARELRHRIADEVDRPAAAIARAQALLDSIADCPSFDHVYDRLGFRYVIGPDGSLDALADNSLDLIVSSDVLEHVPVDAMPVLADAMRRVLRSGGTSAHQIVEADHLCIYDRKVHTKNYLRYSDRVWNAVFANQVQYFNRMQHGEIRDVFVRAGFAVTGEDVISRCDLRSITVDQRFAHCSRDDLEATVTRLIVRKPAG
jgi:hypothetical protein